MPKVNLQHIIAFYEKEQQRPAYRLLQPDPEWPDVDLTIATTETGERDLAVTSTGDLATIGGEALVVAALERRLTTAPYGYRRLVRYKQTWVTLDPEYGNPLYWRLSQNLDEYDYDDLSQELLSCAEQEQRITDISVEDIRQQGSYLHIQLRYTLPKTTRIQSLFLPYQP